MFSNKQLTYTMQNNEIILCNSAVNINVLISLYKLIFKKITLFCLKIQMEDKDAVCKTGELKSFKMCSLFPILLTPWS
jgi:hypothetical protein